MTNKKAKKFLNPRNIVLLLIGVFIVVFLIKYVGTKEVLSSLKLVDIRYIFAFGVLHLTALAVLTYRWGLFVKQISKISYLKTYPIFMAGVLANNLTPGPSAGGEPVRAYFLSKATGKDTSSCFATAIMGDVTHFTSLIGLTLFSIFYVVVFLNVFFVNIFFGIAFLLLILGVAFLLYLLKIKKRGQFKTKASKFLRWLYGFKTLKKLFDEYEDFEQFVKEKIDLFKKTFLKLWREKKVFFKAILVTLVHSFLFYLELWLIFLGLGESISPLTILVVFTISRTVAYFVFLPGGAGAMEISAVGMLSAMGVSAGIAAAGVIIARVVYSIVNYGGGYLALNYLNSKYN